MKRETTSAAYVSPAAELIYVIVESGLLRVSGNIDDGYEGDEDDD